jgi:hypothetical protein
MYEIGVELTYSNGNITIKDRHDPPSLDWIRSNIVDVCVYKAMRVTGNNVHFLPGFIPFQIDDHIINTVLKLDKDWHLV